MDTFKYTLLSIVLLSLFTSCDDFIGDNIENNQTTTFHYPININGINEKNNINDTIWLSFNCPDTLYPAYSNNYQKIQNATFFLQGTLNLLYHLTDSLNFVEKNFDIIVDSGVINIIKISNLNINSYYFDIKYGQPINNNNVKIGLICKYPGIYGLDIKTTFFYGEKRTDYNDYSIINNQGIIYHYFDIENTNSKLFYALPPNFKYYFGSYYTDNDIYNKWYCFFEFNK